MYSLNHVLGKQDLIYSKGYHIFLSDFMIEYIGRVPKIGEIINISHLSYQIIESTNSRINLVRITKITNHNYS
ncbi:transporter associated domain-containing protein [Candidatus Erwinia haradaeae]|uniref:transporter associated domain-containing protein n=1 Tax=Candidatus Erwinia haradaeae TaxID=1922217 RepID=UPI0039E3F7EA